MPFLRDGHWGSVEQVEREELGRRQLLNSDEALNKPKTDVEIRAMYERFTADPSKTFPPFAARGLGLKDDDAFEACVEESDFKAAVRALQKVSRKAGWKIEEWRRRSAGGRK